MKARLHIYQKGTTIGGFNPRAREGATRVVTRYRQGLFSFNPRAREGATDDLLVDRLKAEVSIHAPVKARQEQIRLNAVREQVSIHAPVKARHF